MNKNNANTSGYPDMNQSMDTKILSKQDQGEDWPKRKNSTKDPKQALEEAINDVRQIISDIKKDVIEQNGNLYHIETTDKFDL